MIKDFKFLRNNGPSNYSGEMATEAVSAVHAFILGGFTSGHRVATGLAEYHISETRYELGRISSVTVYVYPNEDNHTLVTFYINVGVYYPYITGHLVQHDERI